MLAVLDVADLQGQLGLPLGWDGARRQRGLDHRAFRDGTRPHRLEDRSLKAGPPAPPRPARSQLLETGRRPAYDADGEPNQGRLVRPVSAPRDPGHRRSLVK
jgi:hypothetical protein